MLWILVPRWWRFGDMLDALPDDAGSAAEADDIS